MKQIKMLIVTGALALGVMFGACEKAQAQYSGLIPFSGGSFAGVPAVIPASTSTNIYAWADNTDSQTLGLQWTFNATASGASNITSVFGWSLDRNTNHLYNVFSFTGTCATTNSTYGTNLTSGAQGYLCLISQTNSHTTASVSNNAIGWSQKRFRP